MESTPKADVWDLPEEDASLPTGWKPVKRVKGSQQYSNNGPMPVVESPHRGDFSQGSAAQATLPPEVPQIMSPSPLAVRFDGP